MNEGINYWPGTSIVKSQNNGFTLGLRSSDADWADIRASGATRAASTAMVERQRADGKKPGAIYGISHKSDERILHGGAYSRAKLPKVTTITGRMREALKNGPMFGPDLGALVGLAPGVVRKMLKYDIDRGHVIATRVNARLLSYALPGAL